MCQIPPMEESIGSPPTVMPPPSGAAEVLWAIRCCGRQLSCRLSGQTASSSNRRAAPQGCCHARCTLPTPRIVRSSRSSGCDMNGNALPATVFVNGINGPDGIAIDSTTGNIWVASGQSDEILVIQPRSAAPPNTQVGKVIAKLGDFNGLEAFAPGQNRAREFLFPASLAFSNLPPVGPAQRI